MSGWQAAEGFVRAEEAAQPGHEAAGPGQQAAGCKLLADLDAVMARASQASDSASDDASVCHSLNAAKCLTSDAQACPVLTCWPSLL